MRLRGWLQRRFALTSPVVAECPKISRLQQWLVAGWIETGADLGRDRVIRWRWIDVTRIKAGLGSS